MVCIEHAGSGQKTQFGGIAETASGKRVAASAGHNKVYAGKDAWTHEVVSQGVRLARASQKAIVKEVPLNSISGCPTIKPGFDDFGAVRHRNQFKGANAGVQFDRIKKVNVIRDKQISDSAHQRDFE